MAKDNTNNFIPSSTSAYAKTYESFSGCDMVAILDINMPDSKGGTLKVTHVLGEMQTVSYSIHMDKVPVRSIGSVNAKDYVFGPRTIAGSLVFAMFNRHIAHEILIKMNAAANSKKTGQMIVMDELPPFNITISMANEYGNTARLAIYGIRIINEGNVMSVNDVYTENTYQFVATDIEYLSDGGGTSSSGYSKAAEYYDMKVIGVSKSEGAKPIPIEPSSKSSIAIGASIDVTKDSINVSTASNQKEGLDLFGNTVGNNLSNSSRIPHSMNGYTLEET